MDPNLEVAAKGIFDRAKSIILTPNDEWPRIEADAKTQQEILMGYVLPLAAIGPVAMLIGRLVFGLSVGIVTVRYPLVGSIIAAAVSFGFAVAGVFVVAFLANALAPNFGGTPNNANAFKLAAYSMTASWIAGIFLIIPQLWIFAALGFYSIYLLFTGITPLMKVPADKVIGYVIVLVICSAIVMSIGSAISGRIATPSIGFNSLTGNSIMVPGGGSIDTNRIEQMSKQAENSVNGKSPPVDAAKMQALMPAAIGTYQRTAIETVGAAVGGSQAEGTYTSGDNNFKLRITDMSALGALAGMAGALGVTQSKEDANGYERTGTVDGHMQTESWNKTDSHGKFGVVVGNRFMVEAEGKAASIDELKAAVASIDPADLSDLAG